jgi:cell division protein FtsQ
MAEQTRREARTRRRFLRRQWARRWHAWRWLVVAALVVALVVGGTWLVWFSGVFGLRSVTVAGTGYLAPDQVRGALDVQEGEPLAGIDVADLEVPLHPDRVRTSFAPVRRVSVTRVWPDGLRVQVEEREAIAVVDIGGVVRGLDDEGVLFRTYPSEPRDLPLVEAGPETREEAIRETADIVSAMPDALASRVDHVEVATRDEVSVVLRDGRSVIWGSAADSEEKARVLAVLLRQEQGSEYDVSVPGRPTVRG